MDKSIYLKSGLALLVAFAATACGGVKVDPDVMQALRAVSTGCTIDTRYAFIKNCKNREKKKFLELIRNKGRAASIGTVSAALSDSDIKVQAVAAGMLYSHFKDYMTPFKKNPELLPMAVADQAPSPPSSVRP